MRFWVGAYTADMQGSASGIGVLQAGTAHDVLAGGPLGMAPDAAAAASPSWLAAHPTLDVLYAAQEGTGTVRAFRRTGEASLAAMGAPVEAGRAVCHVAVAPDGASLVASCWGDGRVVRMTLDASGRPGEPVVAVAAGDPYGDVTPDDEHGPFAGGVELTRRVTALPDLAAAARALREATGPEYAHLVPEYDEPPDDAPAAAVAEASDARVSHAHQAAFLPGGVVATTDMGFDLVRLWRPRTDGLRLVQEVVLPKGSGPRHMVWHPSGHLYVVTELSCEAFVLAADASGSWRIVGGTTLSPAAAPGVDLAAEIALSRDGAFVYAGVRGSNTLATLRVRGGGDVIEPVALVEAGVDWPRHHLVVRDTMLVAGQRSDDIVSLTIDSRNGVPGRVRHRTAAPSPTHLLAVGS